MISSGERINITFGFFCEWVEIELQSGFHWIHHTEYRSTEKKIKKIMWMLCSFVDESFLFEVKEIEEIYGEKTKRMKQEFFNTH